MARLRNLASAAAVAACALAGPAWAETLTLLALGDSLTQGYGLAPEDGFVPRLEAWLAGQGADVQVVNAGVSGDTTAGGRARLPQALTAETDAVLIALGGNDLLRGLAPAEARANLEAMLEEATGRGLPVLLVGLPAPGNYGPDYKAEFDAIHPELAARFGVRHVENFLAPITDQPDRAAAMRSFMQPDGIHPNAEGVALIVEALGPEVLALLSEAGS